MDKAVSHFPSFEVEILDNSGATDTDPLAYASGRLVAAYMGKCGVDVQSVTKTAVVGTGASGVTFAEMGIGVGTPRLIASPLSITPIGWVDIALDVTGGNASMKKSLTMARMPKRGEHVWALYVCSAATPVTWRVCKGAGYGQHGQVGFLDGGRISTNLLVPLSFLVSSAAVYAVPQARVGFNVT